MKNIIEKDNDTLVREESDREQLILKYSYIVKEVANRLYIGLPQGFIDKDDLISEGTLALLTCIDNYCHEKRETFASYIRTRVVGAMKDFLRKQDILPQKKRMEVKQFENGIYELEMKLERKPNLDEILSHLNISEKKYYEITQYINMSSYVYIDSYEQSPLETISVVENESNLVESSLNLLVSALECDELTDNHKIILQMYYYDELSFKHISEVLNLSTARISQLHSQSLTILRKNIYTTRKTISNSH